MKIDYPGLPACRVRGKRTKGSTQKTINMEGKDGECRVTEKIEGSIRGIGSNSGQMSQGERPAAAGVAEKPGKVPLETAGLAARRSLAAQQEAFKESVAGGSYCAAGLHRACNRYTILLTRGNWEYVSILIEEQGLLSQGVRRIKGGNQDVWIQHQSSCCL